VRLAVRQGSAEDQEGWSALLGGALIAFKGSRYDDRNRARAVSPDELAALLCPAHSCPRGTPEATDIRYLVRR